MKNRIVCFVLAALFLTGCSADEQSSGEPKVQNFGGLICLEYSRYTGAFPEDGSGRQVENVAAMLVRNSSDQFLDFATVKCRVGTQIGTFQVTGLPPGGTAWVLEQTGMSLSEGEEFAAFECEDYYFREESVITTDKLSVETDGNTLTVTNESDKTLENVCVYYKTVFEDGFYFGGISYMLEFGELAPGEQATKQSSHFGENSRIVRYSFQESG